MRAVTTSELTPGMILARTIVNDDLVVVLSESTVLDTARISRLQRMDIAVVYIKDEFELNANYQSVAALFKPENAFVSEYKEIVSTAEEIFNIANKDGKPPVYESKVLVHENLLPLARKSGAIDYLFELNHLATDVYHHSMRVSILSGVIAKWLKMNIADVQDVVLAGFLHDIGKVKLPAELQSKNPDTLADEELENYMTHPMMASSMLNNVEDLPPGVKEAALQHHERIDGSGFPMGISGGNIHLYAKIVGLADLYDNITTERVGELRKTPFMALETISKDMHTSLDPNVCIPFIVQMKMNFLGSRVLLSNGMIGTVVHFANSFDAKPLIRINESTIVDMNEQKNIKIVEYNPR